MAEPPNQRLADLSVAFLQHELADAKGSLANVQARHDEACSQVVQHNQDFEAEEKEWIANQIRRQRENEAACLLQNWWLRVGMRKLHLVPLLQILEQQLLINARHRLDQTLLDLRHAVHDLHIAEPDRLAACLRIQRWWRQVLATRIMKVIAFYGTVRKVKRRVEDAASKIQALYRGVCGRRQAQEMRESRQAAEEEAQLRMEQMKMHAILNIQNSYRKSVAVKQVQLLRAQMFAAMMSQGDAHLSKQPNSTRPLWFKAKGKAEPRKKRWPGSTWQDVCYIKLDFYLIIIMFIYYDLIWLTHVIMYVGKLFCS